MQRTDDIIELVYSAAVRPAAWSEAVRAMAASFAAISGGIYVGDTAARRVELIAVHGIESTYVKSYVEHHLTDANPWSLSTFQALGRVRTDTSLDEYHRRPGYYRGTSLFNEWMKPQDFIYTLGVNLSGDASRSTKLFLYRPECAGPYVARDLVHFRRLVRHLMNAVRVAERFERVRHAASDLRHVFDRVRFGLVLLDDHARVLEANEFASQLFERRDGLAVANGRLIATDRASGKGLLDAVRAAAAARTGDDAPTLSAYLERRQPAQPLAVMAVPLPAGSDVFGVRRATVALLVTDPQTDTQIPVERLRRRFALTNSEARLAASLMQGFKLRDAADRAGLTYETARWYIKSTFQKTGTSRQADLIRLLLSDPQLLLPE